MIKRKSSLMKKLGAFAPGLLMLALSGQINAQAIHDIIHPVKVSAERNDTIMVSDLFYADKYNLKFKSTADINAAYDAKSNLLVLKARPNFTGMALLPFEFSGKTYQIPVISLAPELSGYRQEYTFSYKPAGKVNSASVFGTFNGWNKNASPMTDPDGDGTYEAKLNLEPGSYAYKFFVDGREIVDPHNPEKVPTGFDDFNSLITIAEPKTDKAYLHTGEYRKNGGGVKLSFIYERENQPGNLKQENVLALLNNERIDQKSVMLNGNEIELSIPQSQLKGENSVRISVVQKGRATNIQTVVLFDGAPAGNNKKQFTWNDGIIYSIMIDRFNDGDKSINKPVVHDSLFVQANYQGGDLEGIIKKLDGGYFDSLGINVLWISPVYDNPNIAFREYPAPHRWFSGYHGYWPVSEEKVEEKFGTMEKLKELISKAQKKDIKVLLDFVAHHVHIDNPLYKEHPDWFGKLDLPDGRKNLRFWDEFRLTTWFEPYMPSFDYLSSSEAIRYMTDNAVWWLKETGADGFRHDAVKHVPNDFWRELTRKLKKEVEIPRKRKVYQIGETFGDYDLVSSYVNNGQLDAQFNFNLSYFAVPVFAEADKSFITIDHHIKRSFAYFGYNNLMGNILDSHDKVRFMAYADGDVTAQGVDTREMAWSNPPAVDQPESYKRLELAMTYMQSVPGLPVIYYGTEFGMTGADDPDNRRMMRFGNELSALEKQALTATRKITNLRKEHSALRYGDFLTLLVDNTGYAYIRSDFNERIVVVLNKGTENRTMELQIPQAYKSAKLIDLSGSGEIPVTKGSVKVNVPALGWRMFRISK